MQTHCKLDYIQVSFTPQMIQLANTSPRLRLTLPLMEVQNLELIHLTAHAVILWYICQAGVFSIWQVQTFTFARMGQHLSQVTIDAPINGSPKCRTDPLDRPCCYYLVYIYARQVFFFNLVGSDIYICTNWPTPLPGYN